MWCHIFIQDTHSVVKACAEPSKRPAANMVDRIAILDEFLELSDLRKRKTELKTAGGYEELFDSSEAPVVLHHHRQRNS